MPKANRMPVMPDGWADGPAKAAAEARADTPADGPIHPLGPDYAKDGIFGGWQPDNWSLENSDVAWLLGPEAMKEIDFGNAPSDESGGLGSVAPRTVVANEPTLPVINPADLNTTLPDLGTEPGPDRRYYSAAGGTVTGAGWENPSNHDQGYGYRLKVQGDDGKIYIYGHSDPNAAQVHVGDKVTSGQYLGGYADPSNGRSTGPHTHFEVRDPSHPLQPGLEAYIRNSRAMGAVVDPMPFADIVMPDGNISSRYRMRAMRGGQEFHPGVDLNRLPGKR